MLYLLLVAYYVKNAFRNCRNQENHLKFFKLERDFTAQEFRARSRDLAAMYHPDSRNNAQDTDKFIYYNELKEV